MFRFVLQLTTGFTIGLAYFLAALVGQAAAGFMHQRTAAFLTSFKPKRTGTANSVPEAGEGEQPTANLAPQANVSSGSTGSLDKPAENITNKVGVKLAEQQQLYSIRPVDGNVSTSFARAEAHLNEPAWDLSRMLLRENLVAEFDWALTNTPGTEIPIVGTSPSDVPTDLLQNDMVSAPFLRFQLWRCKVVKVRFQLIASRFHQGRLGVYFLPTMLPKALSGTTLSPRTWTQLQHAFLDPADGSVVEMEIPFIFYKGWVDLVNNDVLGQLHVQVLNQLQAASGASTSVSVKVFVSFEGSEFKIPRPGGSSFRAALREQFKREFPQDYAIISNSMPQGLEEIGASVGKELDNVIKEIVPQQLSELSAGVIFDNPVYTEYPEPLIHKDQQYLSPSKGIQKLERLTLANEAIYATDDQFGSSIDEMDIGYLLKKRCYIGTVNWPATATAGTVLAQNIVSPTHLDGITLSTTSATPTSIMYYLANFFTYWRGAIELEFQVVSTAFHEGRLDIANHPNIMIPPSDYVTSQSQYVMSKTIRNVDNTIRVVFPHLSDIPWKRIWQNQTLSDTPSDTALRFQTFAHGSYSLRVAVPLKAPSNVAQNVDINIFLRAGDDFEFHQLSPYSGYARVASVEFFNKKREIVEKKKAIMGRKVLPNSRPQAGDDANSASSHEEAVPLAVARAMISEPKIHHFGESYRSLREILKRYALCQIQSSATSSTSFMTPGPNIFPFQFDFPNMNGMMSAVSQCYRLFRGSLNAKLEAKNYIISSAGVATDVFLSGVVSTVPQPTLSTASAASLAQFTQPGDFCPSQIPMVRISSTQVAEFMVPFQSAYHSLMINKSWDAATNYYVDAFTQFYIFSNMWCNPQLPELGFSVVSEQVLSTAFSDDSRFGVWVGTPPLTLSSPTPFPF